MKKIKPLLASSDFGCQTSENSAEHNLRPIVRLKSGEEIDLCKTLSLTIKDARDNDEEILKAEKERVEMIEASKQIGKK